MSAVSFSEHYSGAFGSYVHERRITGSQSIAMFEMLQPAGDFSDPAVSELVVIETASSMRGDWDFGAGRIRSAESGVIFVVPPNCPTDIVVDVPHLFRAYAVPTAQMFSPMDDCLGGRSPDFGRLQHRGTRNSLVAALLRRLWAAGEDGSARGRLFSDSVFVTLFAELVAETGQMAKPARGGLSPHQLRRVADFIETALDQDIGLADLAREADLSPFHFARSFKQETGLAPFHFLTKRRIARAQLLLQTTDQSLVEVALSCGFAGQSSFTTAFGRQTGMTPGRWRRGVRALSNPRPAS